MFPEYRNALDEWVRDSTPRYVSHKVLRTAEWDDSDEVFALVEVTSKDDLFDETDTYVEVWRLALHPYVSWEPVEDVEDVDLSSLRMDAE